MGLAAKDMVCGSCQGKIANQLNAEQIQELYISLRRDDWLPDEQRATSSSDC